jgi:hypothetical protein
MTDLWDSLTAFSDTYTCYSSALATWTAWADADWAEAVNPGLWLTVTEAGDGLFGFVHFRPEMRRELGLVRTGAGTPAAALDGVLAELERSGRVIVAGDGHNLPWHVAHGRAHVPHWFVLVKDGAGPSVLVKDGAGPSVLDPFACRNELGIQTATREAITRETLEPLLRALPGDDPVLRLRESLALGDDAGEPEAAPFQWYVSDEVGELREPRGASGPDAVLRLAEHFRERGQDPAAYAQADDIWSIGRHRAFLFAVAAREAERRGDDELGAWVADHGRELVKRWGHMAPLIMQAKLTLAAGRPASPSVTNKLEDLAARERAAAEAAPDAAMAGGSSSI